MRVRLRPELDPLNVVGRSARLGTNNLRSKWDRDLTSLIIDSPALPERTERIRPFRTKSI